MFFRNLYLDSVYSNVSLYNFKHGASPHIRWKTMFLKESWWFMPKMFTSIGGFKPTSLYYSSYLWCLWNDCRVCTMRTGGDTWHSSVCRITYLGCFWNDCRVCTMGTGGDTWHSWDLALRSHVTLWLLEDTTYTPVGAGWRSTWKCMNSHVWVSVDYVFKSLNSVSYVITSLSVVMASNGLLPQTLSD